jgi:hypothetical protein
MEYKFKLKKEVWKNRYIEFNRQWYQENFPIVYNDGHWFEPKIPKVNKANGLTMFICNTLKWSSNHGERTNTMGRPIEKFAPRFDIFSGKIIQIPNGVEWQKGTGVKGSSDIKGHINVGMQFPIPIYIEVKIKDKQSDDQKEYEKQITKTGAIYSLVHTPEEFFIFFDYCLNLKKE